MNIYRCNLELMESLFFASREVSGFFQTEVVIGNYALAYALDLCHSGYHNDGEITYREDLARLNEAKVYVTPATFTGKPRFTIYQFNALSESYWYQMEQNAISVDRRRIWDSRWKARASNFPQIGRIKMLSIGNKALFYVMSDRGIEIPRYIRLGKFMSKAKLRVKTESPRLVKNQRRTVGLYLNPNDLAPECHMGMFDLLNIRPVPLVKNADIAGDFYALSEDVWLPAGLRFGVDKGIREPKQYALPL